jgi:hypothetical protein
MFLYSWGVFDVHVHILTENVHFSELISGKEVYVPLSSAVLMFFFISYLSK